jgi:hypothetical protein
VAMLTWSSRTCSLLCGHGGRRDDGKMVCGWGRTSSPSL